MQLAVPIQHCSVCQCTGKFLHAWIEIFEIEFRVTIAEDPLDMLRKKNRQHPFYRASFIYSGGWPPLDCN